MPSEHHANPFMALFQQKAQVMNATHSRRTPADAIDLLADWMAGRMSQLSEEDVVLLSDVGAIFVREGLGKGKDL